MAIIGIDAGNYKTKVCTAKGVFDFDSAFAPYHELYVRDEEDFGPDDMIIEYKGVKEFAGTLAKRENHFENDQLANSVFGDTKYHEDALKRILIAIAKTKSKGPAKIFVGQPITKHSEDKEKIKKMLEGIHQIVINGVKYEIEIEEVNVGVEGFAAAMCIPNLQPITRIIDFGSGTVNYATLKDGKRVNVGSGTITQGSETTEIGALLRATLNTLRNQKWKAEDHVWICGGIAKRVFKEVQKWFPNAKLIFPLSNNEVQGSHFVNAIALYKLAKEVYKK